MNKLLKRSLLAASALLGLAGTAQALPDLILGNVQYDKAHYTAGETAIFSAYIWNDGSSEFADTVFSPIRVSISVGTDPVVYQEFITGIEPLPTSEEKGSAVDLPFAIPADLAPGIYPVTIHIDPPNFGNIWEGSEGEANNTFSGIFLRVDYDPAVDPVVEFLNPDDPTQVLPIVDGCYQANTTAFVGEPYQIRARISDTDGYVRSVEFFADGMRLGEPDHTAPYEASWTPEGIGSFEIGALATDNHGNQGYSCFTVVVTEEEPQIPAITLLSPPDGGSYLPGTELSLLAAPSDADGVVEAVQFFVNGVPLGDPIGAPYQGSFVIPSQGAFNLTAVSIDNDGNRSRQSNVRTVFGGAPDPEIPLVIMESPLPQGAGDTVNDASVGSNMFLSARVMPPQIAGATVDNVVFYINGVSVGNDSVPYNGVYSVRYQAASTGSYSIYAEAIATVPGAGETRGVSAPLLLNVVNLESPFPAVEMEAVPDNDQSAAGVQVPPGTEVNIRITTNAGLWAVDRVDLFVNDVRVEQRLSEGLAGEESFNFTFTPQVEGAYDIRAQVVQIDAGSGDADNWTLTDRLLIIASDSDQTSTPLEPLSDNRDFVYQSYLDLYQRPPTLEEQDAMLERMELSLPAAPTEEQLLNARAAVIVEMLGRDRIAADRQDPQSIDAVRSVLATRHILANDDSLNPWDISRESLQSQVNVVRNIGFNSLLRDHYLSNYATIYGKPLPGPAATDEELNSFIRSIWRAKYHASPDGEGDGADPTQSQLSSSRTLIRLMGVESFLADFIRDYGLLYSGSGSITPLLGFQNVPNDRTPAIADAANMIKGLLRPNEPVSEEEVVQLATVPQLIDQAKQVLSDPRYSDRFLSPVSEAIVTGKDWKVLPWFGDGHFFDGFAPWMWHINYGWIYIPLEGQRADAFWMWDTENGWIMTGSDFYPLIYSSEQAGWILHDIKSNWYWDYSRNAWFIFQ